MEKDRVLFRNTFTAISQYVSIKAHENQVKPVTSKRMTCQHYIRATFVYSIDVARTISASVLRGFAE